MNLEEILPNEINWSLQDKYCIFLLRRGTKRIKYIEAEGKQWLPGARDREKWAVIQLIKSFRCAFNLFLYCCEHLYYLLSIF